VILIRRHQQPSRVLQSDAAEERLLAALQAADEN
jgi:hypothetical protein